MNVHVKTASISGNPYLEEQKRWESSARSYPRRLPIALAKGHGIHVEDTDGRTYIDCLAGAGALALGHNHPVVLEALQAAMRDGVPMQTLDLTTPLKQRFVETLFRCLPEAFARRARIQFCGPSGADAIEAALKLVKTATSRRSVFSFHGGYHGMTHGALSLTGCVDPKGPISGLMPDVHFLPYPYAYRCPFGVGGDATSALSTTFVERLLDDANSGIVAPAAMILEPVQGEGGVIPAPDAWLASMRAITCERGIPLVLDEVQCGFARTGAMFAFEHAGIVPDVLVLSKAIGGGLPLSVVVYDESLDLWAPGAHAGTFRGNQLAMAAGTATMTYLLEHRLHEHAGAMGERMLGHLRALARGCNIVGDVRGRGLMLGFEIVEAEGELDACGARKASPSLARAIQAEALRRGLIVELGGRNDTVVRLLPPLIVTPEQIDAIATILEESVIAAERGA